MSPAGKNRHTHGFTLIEIMIVVAIIALLAAIALPNFLRARKRSQATTTLESLRTVDWAVDQYAIDNNKSTGDTANWADLQPYLKTGSPLYNSGGKDIFGNALAPLTVDQAPQVDAATFAKLQDVADAPFWGPYYSADNTPVTPSVPDNTPPPLTAQGYGDGMAPILALDNMLANHTDHNSQEFQSTLAAAQQAYQTLQSQSTQMNQQQFVAYHNAVTNNFDNSTVNIGTFLHPGQPNL